MRIYIGVVFFYCIVNQSVAAQNLSFQRISVPITQNGVELSSGFAGGLNTPQFSAADLNNDGVQDLVVFDRSGDVLLTYINAGTPGQISYSYAPDYACTFPKVTDYVLMRDFNQDGAADIFCASLAPGSQEMQVFQGYFDNNVLKFDSFTFHYPNCTYCDPYQVWYPDSDQPGQWNNLLIAPTDIPAVDDIDGDGDLDILTFDPAGGHIWYVKNMSQEMGFGMDSLKFRVTDKCWGRFYESGVQACLCDLSPDGFICSNGLLGELEEREDLHAGSTLMTYDQEGDGDKEIVLGDVSFDCLNLLNNGGSGSADWMTSQDHTFPSYDVPVVLNTFPAGFYLDIDNDGKRDMVVAPNNRNIGEDQKNAWFYRNTASNGHNFSLQSKTFLVGNMLDLGSTTHPTFADVNADGLMDLVVGTYGFYTAQSTVNARLTLLLNTGTPTSPRFTVTDEDWLQFSEFTPDNYDFAPTFGDIDGDGDLDLVVGHNDGGFFCYRNAAGPGNPMNLSRDFNAMWLNMDVIGLTATPAILDLTGDNLPDLVVGERNGNINLFTNTGTATHPQYPINPTIQKLGFVDTRLPGEAVGFSAPTFIPTPEGLLLVLGTNSGQLEAYQHFSLTDTFDLVDPKWGNVDEGSRTNPAFADIDQDGMLEMVVGNLRGGLSLFRTTLVDCNTSVALQEPEASEPLVYLSPNPARDRLQLSLLPAGPFHWRALNALGQTVAAGEQVSGSVVLDTGNWGSGIYFVEINAAGHRIIRKVVVQ